MALFKTSRAANRVSMFAATGAVCAGSFIGIGGVAAMKVSPCGTQGCTASGTGPTAYDGTLFLEDMIKWEHYNLPIKRVTMVATPTPLIPVPSPLQWVVSKAASFHTFYRNEEFDQYVSAIEKGWTFGGATVSYGSLAGWHDWIGNGVHWFMVATAVKVEDDGRTEKEIHYRFDIDSVEKVISLWMASDDDWDLEAKQDDPDVRKQEPKFLKGYSTKSALSFRKFLSGEKTYEKWTAENNEKVDDNRQWMSKLNQYFGGLALGNKNGTQNRSYWKKMNETGNKAKEIFNEGNGKDHFVFAQELNLLQRGALNGDVLGETSAARSETLRKDKVDESLRNYLLNAGGDANESARRVNEYSEEMRTYTSEHDPSQPQRFSTGLSADDAGAFFYVPTDLRYLQVGEPSGQPNNWDGALELMRAVSKNKYNDKHGKLSSEGKAVLAKRLLQTGSVARLRRVLQIDLPEASTSTMTLGKLATSIKNSLLPSKKFSIVGQNCRHNAMGIVMEVLKSYNAGEKPIHTRESKRRSNLSYVSEGVKKFVAAPFGALGLGVATGRIIGGEVATGVHTRFVKNKKLQGACAGVAGACAGALGACVITPLLGAGLTCWQMPGPIGRRAVRFVEKTFDPEAQAPSSSNLNPDVAEQVSST